MLNKFHALPKRLKHLSTFETENVVDSDENVKEHFVAMKST